jgi:methylenetetrahydrofolate dehydrogenase (NADP+)/methenyltetrahydrofolate cyclohydrolase
MMELRGKPVVDSLAERISADIKTLDGMKITPKLTVVRFGERGDDIAYERGILKRFSAVNALADVVALPDGVSQEELESLIARLNGDTGVHGILLLRPLPKHLNEESIKSLIDERKDVDCMGTANTAHIFAGDNKGYPPCTAQAVMEILDHYGFDPAGRKVTVVGRSLVVGKPLAMLLLKRNATVTVCHTKTVDLAEECRRADILVACAGAANMITSGFVHSEQVVIDVGISVIGGRLCGDVDYAAVADKAGAITPVPGGVGTVTASVLLKHTVRSAMETVKS